jgi:hypothetical protein
MPRRRLLQKLRPLRHPPARNLNKRQRAGCLRVPRAPRCSIRERSPLQPTRRTSRPRAFAKFVVLLTFVLIFVGGHTRLPVQAKRLAVEQRTTESDGWWTNVMSGWNWTPTPAGIVAACVLFCSAGCGASAHSCRRISGSRRWCARGVLAQAVLGGLRVVLDPQASRPRHPQPPRFSASFTVAPRRSNSACWWPLAAVLSPAWMRIGANARLTRIDSDGLRAL